MDRPRRKRLPHEVPSWVPDGSFFFITINCQPPGTNQLCRAGVGDAVLAAAGYYHSHFKWHCRLMLLMPDHLHAIVFPTQDREAKVGNFSGALKRWIRTELHASWKWQPGCFDRLLRSDESLHEKWLYLQENPVRAGLVKNSKDWPYRLNLDDDDQL